MAKKKKPIIIVVHGVQLSSDERLTNDDDVRVLIESSLQGCGISKNFGVKFYTYENVNDEAQTATKKLSTALLSRKPLLTAGVRAVIDIAGEVVTAQRDTATAKKIRAGLKEMILECHEQGHPTVIAAHSLGSVYALDVVNELMKKKHLFCGDDLDTWPCLGLITFGSPLGLEKIFTKRSISKLKGAKYTRFSWVNFWDPLDPIVSGNIFGKPIDQSKYIGGPVKRLYKDMCTSSKWVYESERITSGTQWLLAHIGYWTNSRIGDKIVELLWD